MRDRGAGSRLRDWDTETVRDRGAGSCLRDWDTGTVRDRGAGSLGWNGQVQRTTENKESVNKLLSSVGGHRNYTNI